MATKLEEQLATLEALVAEMESGDLSLEKSMHNFEQGIKIVRSCQKELKEVEQKVKVLEQGELEDFDSSK